MLQRVQQNATYNESPAQHRLPLASFLFADRQGYCQQFSGAMALLLRMGGVPARVASGFTPGRYDRRRKEYVVRDLDAHSWVEAYFPGLGWVTCPRLGTGTLAGSSDCELAGDAAGVGSKVTQPMPGKYASTHEWASRSRTTYSFALRS